MAPPQQFRAFTIRYSAKVNVIITDVKISPASALNLQPPSPPLTIKALWDTGATNSVIGQAIKNSLKLPVVGRVMVHGVHGQEEADRCAIDIHLPNHVIIQNLPVTVSKGFIDDGFQLLIGMDIIGLGDFAISHKKNNTVMSFCVPSCQDIDFVNVADQMNAKNAGLNRDARRKIKKTKPRKKH